jgi:hypothetical protein
MPLYVDPKKSPAWAKKARAGQASEDAPVALSAPPGQAKIPARAKSPMSRPGTLSWAVLTGWQLGTHQEEGALLVYAWKPTGERTAYLPCGPDTTEATFYRAALDAAVEMSYES